MIIKQKSILIINRILLVINFISILLCIWFFLGVQVSQNYDIDNSLNTTREQLFETMKSYLNSSEFLLLFFVFILIINIIVLIINQNKHKIA